GTAVAVSAAVNLVGLNTSALLGSGNSARGPPIVHSGSGASLEATSTASTTTSSLPSEVVGKLGVGVSVALAIVTDTTTAQLADSAEVHATALPHRAPGTAWMPTVARRGAKPAGTAVTPAVAIAISTVTTVALIGNATADAGSGAVEVDAFQTASSSATAASDALAGGNAI